MYTGCCIHIKKNYEFMTGKLFNRLHKNNKYITVLPYDYKEHKLPKALIFFDIRKSYKYLLKDTRSTKFSIVDIPDDCTIYCIEGDYYTADKLHISCVQNIEDLDLWYNEQFCNKIMSKHPGYFNC